MKMKRRFGELELELVLEGDRERAELPELREPHALAILRPWVDVNQVGSLLLAELEGRFGARELGRLARPGEFFDFTRYRPMIYFDQGVRKVRLPNIELRYARREEPPDFLFLHLLEPHMQGEAYVEGLLELLSALGVRRYALLGSMYDMVPHTRPLLVTGGALGEAAERALARAGVQPSDYQGPTSIVYLLNQRAPERGMESLWFIVSLPHYVQVEEDHMGVVRLLEVLSSLYDEVLVTEQAIAKAEEQRRNLDRILEMKPELKPVVAKLEALYEERLKGRRVQLSPEVERFLREITKDLGKEEQGQ